MNFSRAVEVVEAEQELAEDNGGLCFVKGLLFGLHAV